MYISRGGVPKLGRIDFEPQITYLVLGRVDLEITLTGDNDDDHDGITV